MSKPEQPFQPDPLHGHAAPAGGHPPEIPGWRRCKARCRSHRRSAAMAAARCSCRGDPTARNTKRAGLRADERHRCLKRRRIVGRSRSADRNAPGAASPKPGHQRRQPRRRQADDGDPLPRPQDDARAVRRSGHCPARPRGARKPNKPGQPADDTRIEQAQHRILINRAQRWDRGSIAPDGRHSA